MNGWGMGLGKMKSQIKSSNESLNHAKVPLTAMPHERVSLGATVHSVHCQMHRRCQMKLSDCVTCIKPQFYKYVLFHLNQITYFTKQYCMCAKQKNMTKRW